MERFRYFHFEPMSFDFVKAAWGGSFDHDFLRKSYAAWIEEFTRRAVVFYDMQYSRHYLAVWEFLCRQYGIDLDEDIVPRDLKEMGYYDAYHTWKELYRTSGLKAHEDANDYHQDRLTRLDKQWNPNRPLIGVLDFKPLIDELLSEELFPSGMVKPMHELWFNYSLSNPRDVANQLRKLSYADYLKTEHWQRIRSAMLLIHRARCQSDECLPINEGYWNGWEVDIHVHHTTYKNRGNEQFEDLRLLCKRCHSILHERGVEYVFSEPTFNIYY